MMPRLFEDEEELPQAPRPSYQRETYVAPILTAITACGVIFLPVTLFAREALVLCLVLVTVALTWRVVARDRAAKRQETVIAQHFGILTVVPKPVRLPTPPRPRRRRGRVVTRNMILNGDILTTALDAGSMPKIAHQCDHLGELAKQIIALAGVSTATFSGEGNHLTLCLQLIGSGIPRAEAIVRRLDGCSYASTDRQDELAKGIGRVRSDWDIVSYGGRYASVLELAIPTCSLRTAVFAFAGLAQLSDLRPVLRLVNLLDSPAWQVFGVVESDTAETVYSRRASGELTLARYGQSWRPVCGRPDAVASILDPVRRAI